MQSIITHEFNSRFNQSPQFIVRAPGRVNLIGEHTDYNDGFVLPMAIDRAMWIALRIRNDRQVMLHSLDFSSPAEFSLNDINHGSHWDEYIRGMAWGLQDANYDLNGWDGILGSSIPIGAGLSSSAALEMVSAMAFSVVGNWDFKPNRMAKIGQTVENDWIGANTGIMDQMISASGRAKHAMLIDCRKLLSQQIPFPSNIAVVVMDTTTRHTHTDSGYNERREQCESAARIFKVSHLRDVTMDEFKLRSSDLDEILMRRARHVISENERVLNAAKALFVGDAIEIGRLMNASHTSMRDDFEITNDELNIMVQIAQSQPGCFGARMTGGGFGGSAVALIQEDVTISFDKNVYNTYLEATNREPQIFICKASNGAEVVLK